MPRPACRLGRKAAPRRLELTEAGARGYLWEKDPLPYPLTETKSDHLISPRFDNNPVFRVAEGRIHPFN